MASPADTRSRRPPAHPPPPPASSAGGLDLLTLVIASAAAVVAALVVSHFWGAGTIAATAMTPVIVALVKEGLSKPAQRITEVSARAPSAAARVIGARREADGDTLVAQEIGPGGEADEYRVYGRPSGRHWRVALITGAIAFIVAVAAITLPELVAGRSIINRDKGTTIFRGKSEHRRSQTQTTSTGTVTTVTQTTQAPTVTETAPQTTPTVTQTTPTVTQTTPPPAQTTPAPAAEPTTTVPAP